jgi:hypothetical protein
MVDILLNNAGILRDYRAHGHGRQSRTEGKRFFIFINYLESGKAEAPRTYERRKRLGRIRFCFKFRGLDLYVGRNGPE